jgi:sec-independent protein translocase protein TatA
MHQIVPMIGMPQGWELILIVLVILLLFGAAKLPQLARGTGQALRIFKAETKGLRDDDEKKDEPERTDEAPRGISSGPQTPTSQPVDDPAERARDN